MNRVPTVWVEAPDEDDDEDFDRSLTFELREEWCAVDRDQLVLPIKVLERNGEPLDEDRPALLMQYGGEGLLNDMLLDGGVERGGKYLLTHAEGFGREITRLDD